MRLAAVAGTLWAVTIVPAHAQDRVLTYPQKAVRIIAGSAPGGAVDFIGRLAAQKLTETLGQPFLVEQRAGASGSIATDYVAKRPRTAEQGPRLRGCDPVAGCQRRW